VLVIVNLVAQSTTAWTSILVFKTVEAPRFLKGWTFCGVCAFLCILFTLAVVKPLGDRNERKLISEFGDGLQNNSGESVSAERIEFKNGGTAEVGIKAVA
jgi:hypothetical protein